MIGAGRVHTLRRRFLLACLLAVGVALTGRGFQLQVLEGAEWRARAEDQHQRRLSVPAPRGLIYDRNGVPLAASREAYRIALAPREMVSPDSVESRLRSALGLSRARIRSAVRSTRRWVVLPGRWDAGAREHLEGLQGVYFEQVMERFYPQGEVGRELLGRVTADGVPLGGLELELDSVLRGEPGEAVVRRDARGRPIPGALLAVSQPTPGSAVHLTLDFGLQEIADEALRTAVEETGAEGGDLIFADPETGEILAAASRRSRGEDWRAVTEPYEPGSTLKPFSVAALLSSGAAVWQDTVYGENGHYVRGARTLTDVVGHGWMSVRDVLRYSSNIGMAKLATRLEPAVQYQMLRDFGFGSPTGVSYPSESAGVLRRPRTWSKYSQTSLAIGYEIGVTPLQMTMAYGALANGGLLMEPRLVRELRAWDGRTRTRLEPRVVRRVLPDTLARSVAAMLAEVVADGTGRNASLGTFKVAGKTGTARVLEGGRYVSGTYTASFAGFFPADDPQLVFLAKLDRGHEYGGSLAAPITRETLLAALASRQSPVDRRAVALSRPAPPPGEGASLPSLSESGPWLPPTRGPIVFGIDEVAQERTSAGVDDDDGLVAVVPDVVGRSLRDAAERLHAAGFRVRVEHAGPLLATLPSAGTRLAPGSLVELVVGGGS